MPRIEIIGLEGIPEIKPGDDLERIIVEAGERNGVKIEEGDVIGVKSKIVSKAEGKIVDLKRVKPSERAREIAEATGKDPRLVELVLKESAEVVKAVKGHLIVKTRHGIVCANAGIDRSNVAGIRDIVLLLPVDPDASAHKLREEIRRLTGKKVAIVITDTYGRPLRNGQVDMAIGLCGMQPFRDYRGQPA